MSPQKLADENDGTPGLTTRRNAMKAGAALAGAVALGGSATGIAAANVGDIDTSPTEIFLEIDGIEGESRDHAHEGAIDVLAWSWGAANTGSMHQPRGGGAGRAEVRDLSVSKFVDKASPPLWQGVVSGKHFPSATLTVRKAAGDEPMEFLLIELENVLVRGIETSGTVTEQPIETISLNFARFEITYTPQEPDGTPGPQVGPVGWDIQRNEEV